MYDTICTALAWPGFIVGTGALRGPDPREMAKSDLIVIWGTNPVHTQVNVMTHVMRARKERGAKIAVVDVYDTATMQQADIGIVLKPGTDAALACAIMHVLFRDGYANRPYLEEFSDCPAEFEAHLQSKTPQWASAITGVPVEEIESFARLIGGTPRTYLRLGYGFSRSRNGAVSMHAATSIATVTGAWQHEGGGAFHNNGGIYHWDKSLIEGSALRDPTIRYLDQSRIGPVLTGDRFDLADGPPVTALFVQNTNPVSVCPEQDKVKRGFARDDLFVCVHEQFMTETARMADIVLPATMFLEHDDVYQSGGHQHIIFGPKVVEAPGECRSNHDVICGLAARVGAEHEGFSLNPRELIDRTLEASGWGRLKDLEAGKWIDCQPEFERAHFSNGFKFPDGKYRFKPDWKGYRFRAYMDTAVGPVDDMPAMPDQWDVTENADAAHPFRLATSPARSFLNSTFNETPTSIAKEGGRPELLVHADDLAELGLASGAFVRLGNERGEIRMHVRAYDGVRRGVVIAESVWPNDAFVDGKGINTLTSADQPAPSGGGVFHDNHVWIRPA
jgi:anaerobic selenocysteine-containing dehydrogenase